MRRSAAFTVLVFALCSTAWAAKSPVAVSPGSATGAMIGDTCPTFSWGSVSGAESFELVVYLLGEESEEAKPVLRETFAGSVSGWTPSLDRCLEKGGQYAWSVRAVGKKASDWSSPSLFEVASGPTEAEFEEALGVVRRYLEQSVTSRSQAPVSSTVAEAVSVAGSTGATEPTPQLHAGTEGGIVVNGAVAETKADPPCYPSVGGGRFVNCGNGTVLDTVTGLLWLEWANCRSCIFAICDPSDGLRTWYQANAFAANVRDGTCLLSDHSQAGDWRVPTKAEWQAIHEPTCLVAPKIAGDTGGCYADEGNAWALEVEESSLYWTSTTDMLATTGAFGIGLISEVFVSFTKNSPGFAWPVRGGQ